jgi:RNA polymerase sigma-70 factor (ECF subfamily)
MERLREGSEEMAWARLIDLYAPLQFGWARRYGESEEDAADLVQEVLVALLQALGNFQPGRTGAFRKWLKTILLNKLCDRKRRATRMEKALAQRPAVEETPDHTEHLWEADYSQALARRALEIMQSELAPTTWKACRETVVRGGSLDEVARELGISRNTADIARCRVLRRLGMKPLKG